VARWALVALLALVVLLPCGPLAAQEPPPATPQEVPEGTEGDSPSEGTTEEAAPDTISREEAYRGCIPPKGDRQAWIDWFQRQLHRSACASALWFDGFFGDDRYAAEVDETHGRVALRTSYDEFEGFDVSLRARIHFTFPNMDRRFSAFLSREDESEAVEDRGDTGAGSPLFVEEFEDQDWLIGLGYSPLSGKRRRLSFSGGVKIRSPLEPYGKASYRRRFIFGEDTLLRLRNTVFWTTQRGFGNTVGIELSHVLAPHMLVRTSNFGTFAEDTEGVDWKSVLTLYHDLGEGNRALAYEVGWQGETSAPVTVEKIGLRVTYRQRVFRDWLFAEVVAGVNWPREFVDQPRKRSFLIGIGSEIRFGRQP